MQLYYLWQLECQQSDELCLEHAVHVFGLSEDDEDTEGFQFLLVGQQVGRGRGLTVDHLTKNALPIKTGEGTLCPIMTRMSMA